MQLPLKISYQDVEPSPALGEHIARRAAKLDQFHPRIVSCRVAIQAPKRHRFRGKSYYVQIDLVVPRAELVAGKHPRATFQPDCHVAIDEAFDEAERLLADHARVQRGEVKAHNGTPHGRILRVFHDRGFGFLEGEDGDEIYFHEHSVLRGRFGELEPGMEVRYAEEDGDKGPQASTVELVHAAKRAPRPMELEPIMEEGDRPTLTP